MGMILEISEPRILMSAAGYYIGRVCLSEVDGHEFWEPYDRLSDYMSHGEAEACLPDYLPSYMEDE